MGLVKVTLIHARWAHHACDKCPLRNRDIGNHHVLMRLDDIDRRHRFESHRFVGAGLEEVELRQLFQRLRDRSFAHDRVRFRSSALPLLLRMFVQQPHEPADRVGGRVFARQKHAQDIAGIHREAFALDEATLHATAHHLIE